MTRRRLRTVRRDLGAARDGGVVGRPVDKTPSVRAVGDFELRVLDALDEPVTSTRLAAQLGENPRHVALALGTLRFNRLVTIDRVAGVNVWSRCPT